MGPERRMGKGGEGVGGPARGERGRGVGGEVGCWGGGGIFFWWGGGVCVGVRGWMWGFEGWWLVAGYG